MARRPQVVPTRRFTNFIVIALGALALVALPTRASVTFTGKAPGNDPSETNSASVTFDLSISGMTTNLVVTLSNTATYTPNDGPDILTAVLFTLAGDPSLTRISGVLAAGSAAVENGTNLILAAGNHVGGSWTYASGLNGSGFLAGANQGISSAGFGVFGPGQVFPDAALPGDSPIPDGVGGGITTVVDGGTTDGLNGRPFIRSSAVFTLGAVPASFQLTNISDVSFAYGTVPDSTIVAVPEPSTVALVLCGVAMLLQLNRRRR